MEKNLDIILLDKLNNAIEEFSLNKPDTFDELKIIIKNNIKNLPNSYNIYYISENNGEIIINNTDEYKLSKSKLFIKETVDLGDSTDSLFSLNYNKLSESQQEELDEKYNCNICEINIKNEKPLLCYRCQKIFHKKCLDDWNNKCHDLNINFNCPKCKFELPLNDWKEKINYEEERQKEAKILDKLINADNIKDYKLKEINNKYNNYKLSVSTIFKELMTKINEIRQLFENNYISNIHNLNYDNPNEIFHLILKDLEIIKNQMKIKIDKENQNKIIDEYLFKNYNMLKGENDNEKELTFNAGTFQQKNPMKKEIYNYNKQIKEIKNEIICIYIPNYREENEINLIHDYQFNKEEFPINSPHYRELYLKKKKILPNLIKENIELYIDNIKVKFDFKYKIKESKTIKMKFKFKKILNDISFMFCNCRSLISIDLNNFYSNELINAAGTFCDCSSLKNINFSNFNTTKINDMSYLFYGCNSLENLNLLAFNTVNVKSMSGMFSHCDSLKSINLSSFNTSNLEFMDKMFYNCKSLALLDLSSFDTSKVTNTYGLFDSCCSLKNNNIKIKKGDKKILKELNKI